jgi:hypothetical protein
MIDAGANDTALATVILLKSLPLGKYCRNKPLVFSLVPRCQDA